MQRLDSPIPFRGRVVFFVPRWLPSEWTDQGVPYRVFPVLSSLASAGFTVDLLTEVRDGSGVEIFEPVLGGATAAVVWLAELNPAVQINGMCAALETMKRLRPGVPRIAGGGFLSVFPAPGLDLGVLADEVIADDDVSSLSRSLVRRCGAQWERSARRYDAYAARHLDLSARPSRNQ